jgi:hypothetical protein
VEAKFFVRPFISVAQHFATFAEAIAYADRLHCAGREWVGVYAVEGNNSSLVASLLSPEDRG